MSWGPSSFPGGGAVSGYVVKRYDATDQAQTVLSNCNGHGLRGQLHGELGAGRRVAVHRHTQALQLDRRRELQVRRRDRGPGVLEPRHADADRERRHVHPGGPATNNFGTAATLNVESDSTRRRRTLVRFALPSVPSGCRVTAATLRLNASAAPAGRTINAQRAAASWVETTATWANGPAPTGDHLERRLGTAAGTSGASRHRYGRCTAARTPGFVLQDANEGVGSATQTYSSREGANAPQLVLTFGSVDSRNRDLHDDHEIERRHARLRQAGRLLPGVRQRHRVGPLTTTANVNNITSGPDGGKPRRGLVLRRRPELQLPQRRL